jgi:uncharacterized protein YnzC (UPF0291/DUF896 family)
VDRETVTHMLSLARKKRESPLSEQEDLELAELRRAYLADFRAGFRQQLDNIYVEQNDGSYEKLHPKTIPPDEKETPDDI